MAQLLVRLPDEVVRRLRNHVPARQRSAFVQKALECALPPDEGDDDPLHKAALAVEQDDALALLTADWDVTIADGLGPLREP